MDSLATIFNRIGHFGSDIGGNDKNSTHSYLDSYDQLFAPYRESGSILEIGLGLGKSLELWSEYFGKQASIHGIDISVVFDPSMFDSRVKVIEADATKPSCMKQLGEATFDIIIDDGSHMEADQEATFRLFCHRVNRNGIYIIEDILDPESSVPRLKGMHWNCEVIDLRNVKGRFDDMLLVYRFNDIPSRTPEEIDRATFNTREMFSNEYPK